MYTCTHVCVYIHHLKDFLMMNNIKPPINSSSSSTGTHTPTAMPIVVPVLSDVAVASVVAVASSIVVVALGTRTAKIWTG